MEGSAWLLDQGRACFRAQAYIHSLYIHLYLHLLALLTYLRYSLIFTLLTLLTYPITTT